MSKGGGQGSFAQMQEPGMNMDMGGFGGGVDYLGGSSSFNESFNPGPYRDTIAPQPQPFDAGLLMPEDNRQGMPSLPPQGGLSDNITGFIPYSPDNASGGPGRTVIGGENLFPQLQPIDQPIASPQPQPRQIVGDPSNPMLQELRPLPQPGGFGGAMRRFNNLSAGDRERLGDLGIDDIFGSGAQRVTNVQTQGPESMPRLEEQMRMNEISGPARPDPLDNIDLNRFSGGLGSKGGRSNPYQTDGIVPPDMGGGRVFAGGTPNFNERTGEYRTGGIKPPRGPVKLQPIKMQPMPFEPVLSDGPDFRPPPEDIESRGTVGPGGGTRGRTGIFRDAIREFRDEFRYQPMPRREPPIFGPPRNFPFPMPRPPRMPPRQPPRMPGRNTQFQMPFFGSQYGRMNPYAGQFSGYGVPSNMFSFAQPNYQPYVPQAYTPPPTYTPPPPTMQLPPGQGAPTFGGGYGGFSGGQGIGGFGRYNLGLARRQFGGR